ncbi:MAG: hypothetical protein WDW38_001789 [Sanguina aurantia]
MNSLADATVLNGRKAYLLRCLEELADASSWFEVPEGLLQLVLHLSEDPASCTVLTSLLASQDLELLHHLTWLLRPKDTATAALSQSGEAAFASATGMSMLLSVRILTAALTAVGPTSAHLQAVHNLVECAGRHIFSVASTLLLQAPRSDVSSSLPGSVAAHADSWDASADSGVTQHAITKLAVLQLLRVLTDAGVLLDVVDEVGGRDGAASAATAQQLLAGVKSCLLQQDVTVQLAAVQLVCCSCRNAHARCATHRLCSLSAHSASVLLSPGVGVTAGGTAPRQQTHCGMHGLAPWHKPPSSKTQVLPSVDRVDRAAAARMLLLSAMSNARRQGEASGAALCSHMSCLGPLCVFATEALFGRHVRCGVEPLTQLCGDSVASGNMPLAAQVMALLLLAVGHASPAPGQGSVWCQPLSMADVARIVNMVLKVFPTSSTAPGVGLSINSAGVTTLQPLPQESLSAAVSACEILRTICLQWGHNTTSMLPPLAKGVALAMTGLSAVATVSLGSADGDADISTAATCFCDSFATGGWIRLCFTTATLWPQRPDLVYQVWRVLLLTSGCINPTSSRHSNGITGRQDSGLTPENVDPTAACLVTFVRLESLLQAVASGEGCGSHAQQSHSLPHASLASITLSILRTMWEAGELPFQAAWLLSALGQVAHTLSGVAVPSDAGSSSQLLEQYVLLYIDVDRKHTGEQQHSLQLADGLPEAIQQLIAVSPHLLDLHSPFSAWLLHHAEHVPSSAVVAVKGWLLQAASEASPCQRDALQASIAEVLTGSEGLLVTLLQILQAPRQSSRDPAHLQLLCSALAVMRVGLRIQQQVGALQQQLLTVTRRLLLAHLPRALTAAGSAACVHAVQLLLLRLSMSPHQPSLDSLPSHQQPGEDEGECASRDRGDPESNIAGSCGWDQLDHAILLQLQTCIAKLIRRDAAEDAARDACLRPLLQVMLQLASVLVVRDCFLHHPPSGDATVTHILRDSPLWGVVRSCLAQAATSQDHAGQTSEGDTTVLELHQSPRSATACRSGHRVALPQAAVGRSGSGPNDSSCESDGLRSVGAVQQEDGDDDDHMVLAALQLQLACLVGDVVQGAPSQGTQRQRVDVQLITDLAHHHRQDVRTTALACMWPRLAATAAADGGGTAVTAAAADGGGTAATAAAADGGGTAVTAAAADGGGTAVTAAADGGGTAVTAGPPHSAGPSAWGAAMQASPLGHAPPTTLLGCVLGDPGSGATDRPVDACGSTAAPAQGLGGPLEQPWHTSRPFAQPGTSSAGHLAVPTGSVRGSQHRASAGTPSASARTAPVASDQRVRAALGSALQTSEQQQQQQLLLCTLQNAAVASADSLTRASALFALAVAPHSSWGCMVGAAQQPPTRSLGEHKHGQRLPYAYPDAFTRQVLRDCLTRLSVCWACKPAGTFRASGAQGPTSCAQGDVLQGQALLPGLSFLLSLLHILPHHAASLADASGSLVTGQSLRPAPCRAEAKQQGPDDGSTAAGWVLLECQSALEHNLLLNILLDPPPAAAPTVHQVIAQLLPTGLLHPHLTQLRAALRSHVWEESQMAKVEQSAHGTRHGAHAAAGRESDAGTLSSADQVGAPEEGRDAWTRRNTHGGGLAAGQTGGPRYEDSQYHSQSCPNKPQWDHELVTGMGADAPSGCSRK